MLLFPSVNFDLKMSIILFKPFGRIFICASSRIFSIFSAASFFSGHFPLFKFFWISAFIFLLTSTGWKSSNPVDLFFPVVLLLFFFLELFGSFGLITVTFANSASINFNVDSLISLINILISSPMYLYKIHKNCVALFLTPWLLLFAINLQKSAASFIGNSVMSYSSKIFWKNVENSVSNFVLFFFISLEMIVFITVSASKVSIIELIRFVIDSFSLMSENFS